MAELVARLVADTGCLLGESPFWDRTTDTMAWVDIDSATLLRFDGSRVSQDPLPIETSFVTPENTGSLIAVHPAGIDRLGSPPTRLLPTWFDPAVSRPNDGAVDSRGRLWVGHTTRERKPGSGAIGVVADGEWTPRLGQLTLPNGIGWSPDHSILYYVDTLAHTLWQAEFDPDTAATDTPRPFFLLPPEEGLIDGICVDTNGRIWAALWGGNGVLGLDPDGSVGARIELAAPKVTSCAFVDTTLFVTTANPDRSDPPGSGGLFAVDLGVEGVPVPPVQLA